MSRYLVALSVAFSFLCFPTSVISGTLEFEPLAKDDNGLLFTIHGSNTVGAHLAPNWAQGYLRAKGVDQPLIKKKAVANEYRIVGSTTGGDDVYIDIAAHGSSTGFRSLLANKTDIAMSSRAIKTSEVESLSFLGGMRSFDAEHVVAIDGLAVVVNKENPVSTLTVETIAQIFSGQIRNWNEVNGRNLPIKLYARDNNSGTWDTFKSLVLKKQYKLASSAERFESNDDLSDSVSRDPGGIGFVGLASVRHAKVLAVSDGGRPLKPSSLYVATEDYPLSRRLFMYVAPKQANPFVDEFLRYTQSDGGQNIVEHIGFVSQKPVSVLADSGMAAPQDYLTITQNAERLSINFRFKRGGSRLDNKARRDIQRLVNYISREENINKHIQLIGFGDEKSRRTRELVLSKMRAIAVKTALYKEGVSTEPVMGFGSWLPVAEHSDLGKIKNQRVEVWLYDSQFHAQIKSAREEVERNILESATVSAR